MDIKDILSYLGIFLVINAITLLLPVPVALYYNEPIMPFLIGSAFSWFSGSVLMRLPKRELKFGDSMLLVSIGLIIISIFSAIPTMLDENDISINSFINSYFDSVSGYSTAGFTTIRSEMLSPESPEYRYSIIFSRTLKEWLGGLGIVILFLSTLAHGGISTVYLYRMEYGNRRILPNVEHTARFIFRMYFFYTVVGTIALWIFGNDFFYAITGTMSMLATGGFITNDLGFHVNQSGEYILLITMMVGAIPFTMSYVFLSGNLKKFMSNIEIRTGLLILSVFMLLFTILSIINNIHPMDALYNSFVGIVSAMSTSGYSTSGLDQFGDVGKFLLIMLMVIGAGSASTGGGLKLIRIGVMIKSVKWLIKKYSLPETAVLPFKVDGQVFDDEDMRTIMLFFFIYIVLMSASTIAVLVFNPEYRLVDALMLTSSIQGTVGFNTNFNVADQPIIVRLIFIFQMIAGRVEIFPILALIGYIFRGFSREIKDIEDEIHNI
ncbi:MAG TPA: TrkH family potassium uptake protein [Candidatus Altiarchaeales archaeon]|nr:TrkH family potassium uptake protein [Candidatus Altiarchaeales archaeon]